MTNALTLAVYFDDPDEMGYPFDNSNYYWAYQGFSDRCAQEHISLVIVRGASNYLGQMTFSSGWKYRDNKLVKINQPITVDIIYVKGQNLITQPEDYVVNNPSLAEICRNKILTYKYFGNFMASTYSVDETNWREVVKKISTTKIVVKPVTGMEGDGIVITEKERFNYAELHPKRTPYLAQEFLDSSAGIPGLVQGLHDLRLYIFNGQAKIAEYRQPKPGGLLANIAQGGSLTVVPIEHVPDWALHFVRQIDTTFEKFFPRIYTIDLMFANGRPYLVELNSRPGMPYKEWGYYDEMQQAILDTLLSRNSQRA